MASRKPLAPVPPPAAACHPLPHGLDAPSLVIPGEDPAQLDALARDYYGEHRPQTPTERHFTDALVLCGWRRRRYARIEAEMFRHLVNRSKDDYPQLYDRKTPIGQQFVERNESFNKLFRQINANDRAYERALKSLRALQARRPSPPPPGSELPPPHPEPPVRAQLHAAVPIAPAPAPAPAAFPARPASPPSPVAAPPPAETPPPAGGPSPPAKRFAH